MPSQKKILVVTQHFWPENFRINDIVEGFLQDGIAVDVLCGLPNYPKGEWFPGYSAAGPFEEEWHGARLYRCKEVPRRGNTSVNIFLNYVSWPWYAAHALHRLPGGYDAVFCFNTSPVLMCWPAIRYAKKHHIPFTNYVLDIWPENLYSVLNVKNKALRAIAQGVSDALYKKADRLIAMSEPLQQRLCQRTGMPPQKIAVIPQYCEDFYAVPQLDAALQAQFGGDLDDLVEALAFAEAEPQYPKTMGGRVWWREIWKEKGYRIQQNVVSGHFRLLDRENRRLMASFTLERVMERLKEELQ